MIFFTLYITYTIYTMRPFGGTKANSLYPDQTTHTGASAQGFMTIPRRYYFRGSFVFLCLMFLMLSRLFIAALCSPAGKGLTSSLFMVMFIVFLLLSNLESWVRCGA